MSRTLLILLLSSCGPRLIDCPPGAEEALASAMPSESLGRMDVFCRQDEPRPNVPCLTWWYGSGVARGKMEAHAPLAGPCILHEAQHWALMDDGDACASHSPDCGWEDL